MQTIIDQIWPLFQVVLVDLVLAGDNAIVVSTGANGRVSPEDVADAEKIGRAHV